MKNKDYDKKRKDLKDLKRENKETHFEDTKHRKAFINDIKRSFRSVKRSERQVIKKELKEIVDSDIDANEEECYIPDDEEYDWQELTSDQIKYLK